MGWIRSCRLCSAMRRREVPLLVKYGLHHSSSLSRPGSGSGGVIAEPSLDTGGTTESNIDTSGPVSLSCTTLSLPPANPTLPSPSGVLPTFPAPTCPTSTTSFTFALPPKPNPIPINRKLPPTHQPTPPTTLSSTLLLMIHPTHSRKNRNAAKMIRRSYQSAFSSCLIMVPEASRREV